MLASFLIAILAATADAPIPVRVAGDSIVLGAPPVALPAGAKMAVLEGVPLLRTSFTARVQLPSSRAIGPYSTNDVERITILSGRVRLTTSVQGTAVYGAGSFFSIPPKVEHTVEALDDTVFQVTSVGPWPSAPAGGGPSPEATIPPKAEGMTMEIVSIDVPTHAIVNESTVVKVTVRYSVDNFRPDAYRIVPMVELHVGATRSLGAAAKVERPAGTLTFELPMADAITDRQVRKPIRLWFFLMRSVGDNRSRPELRTETIEYLTQ